MQPGGCAVFGIEDMSWWLRPKGSLVDLGTLVGLGRQRHTTDQMQEPAIGVWKSKEALYGG